MPRSDPSALARLREVLLAERYTDAGLASLLGGTAGFGLPAFDPAVVSRRLPDGGALRDLVTLFLLGGSVRRKRAERLFAKRGFEDLAAAGILVADGDEARATVAIHAWADLLLACDRLDAAGRSDQVVGMTPAAVTLAHLTVRREAGATLDLGTGCGVGALLAAPHSQSVVATDLNPRALEFAAVNARLNGIGNVELEAGSWFEPVRDRSFDLIVSNPPFVISPDATAIYRDSDDPDDAVSRGVVTEAARHLTGDGYATVLCNWIRRSSREHDAPLTWVADTGCDAIVLRYGLDDPVSYAASWNHELRMSDRAAFDAALDRWTEHYRRLGVQAIGSGAVVLRKRAGATQQVTALAASEVPTGPSGAQLRRIFAALDVLAGGDEALLASRLRTVDGLGIEQLLRFADGGATTAGGLAVLEPGAGLTLEVDTATIEILERLDGARTLADLAAASVLPAIRRLLELGAVEVVGYPR